MNWEERKNELSKICFGCKYSWLGENNKKIIDKIIEQEKEMLSEFAEGNRMNITIFFNKGYLESSTYLSIFTYYTQGNYLIIETVNKQDNSKLGVIFNLKDIEKYHIENLNKII